MEKKFIILSLFIIILVSLGGCRDIELPQSAIARFINAKLAYEDGDLLFAVRELSELIKEQENFTQAELLLGKSLFFLNRPTEAKEILEKLHRTNPEFYEAGYWLGRTYLVLEENTLAMNQFLLLNSQNNHDFRIMHQIGLLHMEQGNFREALHFLHLSLAVRDELAQVALTLGQLYYSQNLFQESIDSLKTVQELASYDSPTARAATQILSTLLQNQNEEGNSP